MRGRRAVVAAGVASAAVLLAAAVVVTVSTHRDPPQAVRFAPAERTVPRYVGPDTSVAGVSSSLPPAEVPATAAADDRGARSRPTAPARPPVCRNSTDWRCGPASWDPAPPMNTRVERIATEPAEPVAGDRVRLVVTRADPDAPEAAVHLTDFCALELDGVPTRGCGPIVAGAVNCPFGAFGPWGPPPFGSGRGVERFELGNLGVGRYRAVVDVATFSSASHQWPCGLPDPYGGRASASFEFTVRRVGPTTTATTTTRRPRVRPPRPRRPPRRRPGTHRRADGRGARRVVRCRPRRHAGLDLTDSRRNT